MTRPVFSVDLSPRENRHVGVNPWRDVADIVAGALLGFIILTIVVMVMA